MSSYFDAAAREVADDFGCIAAVEARVIRDVLLVAGDVDTPEGTREILTGTVALWRYESPAGLPPTKGREQSDVTRRSVLIAALHMRFHDIAACNIVTRFGRLSDDPREILAAREAYVQDHAGTVWSALTELVESSEQPFDVMDEGTEARMTIVLGRSHKRGLLLQARLDGPDGVRKYDLELTVVKATVNKES